MMTYLKDCHEGAKPWSKNVFSDKIVTISLLSFIDNKDLFFSFIHILFICHFEPPNVDGFVFVFSFIQGRR